MLGCGRGDANGRCGVLDIAFRSNQLRSGQQWNTAHGSRPVKAVEELIVCAAVYFLQFNNNACTDI